MSDSLDHTGAVPYGQDCTPGMLSVLPVDVFFKAVFKSARCELFRIVTAGGYANEPLIEGPGHTADAGSYYDRLDKIVPLSDAAALAEFPVGSKVYVDTRHPTNHHPVQAEGVVLLHGKRRARVLLQFNDGSVIERAYYPNRLYPVT